MPTPRAVVAQSRTENFPVAMRLLGPRTRRHLLAIYSFARLVDDIGDEAGGHIGDEVRGERLALLDQIERELDAPEHPVMRELSLTVRDCRLPREPFLRLIEANRRDQEVTRYDSFEELLGYCWLSAAPVGELVLHVFGAATPYRIALSDKVCAALQVIEHLQDVDEDRARGRVYIGSFDAAIGARALLDQGAPLVGTLRGRARLAVAGFVAGGRVALDALEADAAAGGGGLRAERAPRQAERGSWRAERAARRAERGSQPAERGGQPAERGVQRAERGVQRAERGVQRAERGVQRAERGGQRAFARAYLKAVVAR
jgi:phytoene/squalene synthetase